MHLQHLQIKKVFLYVLRKLFLFWQHLCPRGCPFCLRSLIEKQRISPYICSTCLAEIKPVNYENSLILLENQVFILSLYLYEDKMRQAIRQLKFHEGLEFCPALNDLFFREFLKKMEFLKDAKFYKDEQDKIWSFSPFNMDVWINFEYKQFLRPIVNPFFQKSFEKIVFLPIPLHFKRQQERGYNQVTQFLKFYLEKVKEDACLEENLLFRSKESQRQTEMKNKEARQLNVSDIFRCNEYLYSSKERENFLFVVVDDVKTTGYTLNSAIDCLKKHGFYHLLAVALSTEI